MKKVVGKDIGSSFPIDPAVAAIILKLEKEGMIRHVNGNTQDNHPANLQRVSFFQALQNKNWVVDAVCILDDDEFQLWEQLRRDWKVVTAKQSK
jgi:hypothetical protein